MKKSKILFFKDKEIFNLEKVKSLQILFRQNGKIILRKSIENCEVNKNILSIKFTEEEIKLFSEKNSVEYAIEVKQ